MKKIKHSKYKNTGILFELLVRQIASDTMNNNKSRAMSVLRKHFKSSSELGKELQLYQTVVSEKFNSEYKAEKFVNAVVSARKKLSETILKRQKYNLIKDIKETFDLHAFFKSRVTNYKVLASTYQLFEFAEIDNPASLINAKTVLIEHINNTSARKTIVSEIYNKQHEDVRILSQRMLIDKFNEKYTNLNESQKTLLREYINNISNSVALKEYVANSVPALKASLIKSLNNVGDKITKIKLKEVINMLNDMHSMPLIKDKHVLTLLRYYELEKELKSVK